jgi:hypothetical protein
MVATRRLPADFRALEGEGPFICVLVGVRLGGYCVVCLCVSYELSYPGLRQINGFSHYPRQVFTRFYRRVSGSMGF